MYRLYLVALALLVTGCVRQDESRRVLTQDGFTNIYITGWKPLSCGDDFFSTGFIATKNGLETSGTVCSGFLKGYTIRFD